MLRSETTLTGDSHLSGEGLCGAGVTESHAPIRAGVLWRHLPNYQCTVVQHRVPARTDIITPGQHFRVETSTISHRSFSALTLLAGCQEGQPACKTTTHL